MALRIAELRDGTFIIQKRCFFFWWYMARDIADATFDCMHKAHKVAQESLHKYDKGAIIQTWKVM